MRRQSFTSAASKAPCAPFALDLPFGHYDIEVTDETNAILARYPDVVVDGEVTLDAPSVGQR
jgi:hypothetical protein